MGQSIEVGTTNVPGVGLVAYRMQVTKNAGGGLHMRVLQDARYVETNRPVASDEHHARIANHLQAN